MSTRTKIVLLCFLSLLYNNLDAQRVSIGNAGEATWQAIAPYFNPGAEYQNSYGLYRSPLKFYNGKTVKTPADWKKRRNEIRAKWTSMMGQWPPLLKEQRMVYLDTVRKEGYSQIRVKFNWTPIEETTGYLLIPDGGQKKPAVITVYYEPETAIGLADADHPYRDFAYQLVKRGFVTMSIGTTKATEAKTYGLYYPSLNNAKIEPLSMLAYAAANAWYVLSKVPAVDSTRIGIMGHSFGGKWAMFASCLFNKFACAVWSDPGIVFDNRESVNYWEPWYLGYHPQPWRQRGLITKENPARGLYPKLVKEGFDLHELHALMAPRPFLVSGGSEDFPARWIPLNHSIAVNKFLGFENRVAMTNRPAHSPTPESNEQAFRFLQFFLQEGGL